MIGRSGDNGQTAGGDQAQLVGRSEFLQPADDAEHRRFPRASWRSHRRPAAVFPPKLSQASRGIIVGRFGAPRTKLAIAARLSHPRSRIRETFASAICRSLRATGGDCGDSENRTGSTPSPRNMTANPATHSLSVYKEIRHVKKILLSLAAVGLALVAAARAPAQDDNKPL